jgi:outer membrane protein OmpA-like peptidoglycan-associated protein
MLERSDADQGVTRFVTDVWPLLALGVIGALIIRACVPAPAAPAAAGASAYDPQTAPHGGNYQALASLSALTPQSDTARVLEALNQLTLDFPAGSATLPDSADAMLAKVAAVLAARPASERFEISGHADGTGSPLADLELARRRAQAVVDYLVNLGVPEERLAARGIADPDTPSTEPADAARVRNQRLEFSLLP